MSGKTCSDCGEAVDTHCDCKILNGRIRCTGCYAALMEEYRREDVADDIKNDDAEGSDEDDL